MSRLIFGFLLLSMAFSALAKSDEVLIIRNDIDSNINSIIIESDSSGKLISVRNVLATSDKKVLTNQDFDLKELKAGAAVQVKKGKEIVKIKFSSGFDPIYGGAFDLDYLYNGIKGTRKQLGLDLRKNGSAWEVTHNNKPAKRLNVIAKRAMVVGAIGIEQIKFE